MVDAQIQCRSVSGLTNDQRQGLLLVLQEVNNAAGWSFELPVLLRDRAWLRLSRIPLQQLHRLLPPDGREEAPELIRYRSLLKRGLEPLIAQEQCWHEFGMADCQRAQKAFWKSREHSNHGWTAERYRRLISGYRVRIERRITTVPMLVLARQNSDEHHELVWVSESTPVMRHTCA